MASQGPLYPSTAANDATVGTTAWGNINNIKTDNGVFATAGLGSAVTSQYAAGSAYGFSIPAGATINGIVAEVKNKCDVPAVKDTSVRLFKAGSVAGTDKAANAFLPTASTYATYGSASDLWGTTWTASDINATGFGAGFSCKAFGGTDTAYVDAIRITVYYTLLISVPLDASASTSADTIAVTATTQAPLAASAGTSTTFPVGLFPTPVPLAASGGTSAGSLSLSAQTVVSLDVSAAVTTTASLALTPATTLATSVATSTAALTLTAAVNPTPATAAGTSSTGNIQIGYAGLVFLATSASTSTASGSIKSGTLISLSPSQSSTTTAIVTSPVFILDVSAGVSAAVGQPGVMRTFVPLATCVAVSTFGAVQSARRRAYLSRASTQIPPPAHIRPRGWTPRRAGAWDNKF